MEAAGTALDRRDQLIEWLRADPAAAADILIAGAGIAGLALALALARRGLPSHVLERRAAFAEEGAGIQIGPNGTRLLQHLGIAELLRPHVGSPEWLVVHDAGTGRQLARMPLNGRDPERFGSPYWTVHREDLHAALLTHVRAQPGIRLSHASEIVAAGSTASRAGVLLRDGEHLAGPVVVGADGLRSVVRDEVSGPIALSRTGQSAFRSVVPANAVPKSLAAGEVNIWLTPDAHVVHYPVRGGSEVAIIVITRTGFRGDGWSHEAYPAAMFKALPFCGPLRDLLHAPGSWRQWSLSTTHAPIELARERLALVGDAGHPILPFLAQGGVMALEDAAVLAGLLADTPQDEWTLALQRYRTARMHRVRRVAEAARRNGRIYHMHGVMRLARNAVFRVAPGQQLMRMYDWVYGWRL